jgi:putative flippase GtrA
LAVQRKFRTTVGKRFSRFFVAAVAAVLASQATLAICLGEVHWTAGRSALAAWVAGAGTSYLVSRWAWERKGRPHVLKETIPFWVVAIVVAIAMGLTQSQQVIFDGAAYFLANTVTFLLRFVLFHYVLFADRKPKTAAVAAPGTSARANGSAGAPVNGVNGSAAAPVNGLDGPVTPAEPAAAGLLDRGQDGREGQSSAPLAQRRG